MVQEPRQRANQGLPEDLCAKSADGALHPITGSLILRAFHVSLEHCNADVAASFPSKYQKTLFIPIDLPPLYQSRVKSAAARSLGPSSARTESSGIECQFPAVGCRQYGDDDEDPEMAEKKDHEDEDIDVGEDSDPCMASPQGAPSSIMPPAASTPNLITPTPILGLPHPPALQLRPLLAPTSMIRPPPASALGMDLPLVDPTSTSLSALLPAHLARLSQAATGGNRLYRPFVA